MHSAVGFLMALLRKVCDFAELLALGERRIGDVFQVRRFFGGTPTIWIVADFRNAEFRHLTQMSISQIG